MKYQLTNLDIAGLCRELALLLHAGVQPADGLTLLAEEERDPQLKQLCTDMARELDRGTPLAAVLREADAFPTYVVGLVEVGERTGHTEETLSALSRHYESRERMDQQVRSALTYPAILLLLMLVVIAVLLSRVLPVFDEVYASLGGHLTGVAGGLLVLGQWLDAIMPVLCVLLAVAALFLAAFSLSSSFRAAATAAWRRRFGDRGISRRLNDARFAQALAMGLRSGLPLEEAVDLAASLLQDVPGAAERCHACRTRLDRGEELSEALRSSEALPATACRLLALGLRSGSGDTVMAEIARRLLEDADLFIERRVAQVEPTLVLVTSLLVGSILMSVMLPLMHIMTAIG